MRTNHFPAGVFVSDAGLLRRVVVHSRERAPGGVRSETSVTATLSGFGKAAEVRALPDTPRRVAAPSGPSQLLYPLGPSVAAAVQASGGRR